MREHDCNSDKVFSNALASAVAFDSGILIHDHSEQRARAVMATIGKIDFGSVEVGSKRLTLVGLQNSGSDTGTMHEASRCARIVIAYADGADEWPVAAKCRPLLAGATERLKAIAARAGKFQVLYAGKAHPQDSEGKKLIQRIWQIRGALRGSVKVAYLANYDWELGQLLTAGSDLWLNTPNPPMEASGTSGMKAALNGVPSMSILDGWWIEGCIEGTTGWAIDSAAPAAADRTPHDASSLYDKLERVVLPLYQQNRDGWLNVMRHAIALNGSFFNTQRMLFQYVLKAYFE